MAESHLACPDCETPVHPGRVQISGFDRPVQCPGCGEVFMPWMLKVVHGLRSYLAGPSFEDTVSFATPYIFVPVTEASSLNSRINGLTDGGTIWLEHGNYAAAGDLTFTNSNVTLMGCGQDKTILTGSVTLPGNQCRIENLRILGAGKPYAVKLFNPTAGPNRNHFTKVGIGGTDSTADGPTGPGVWLDGAILNVFDHCTIAHCGTDGLYVNTTDPSVGGFSTNVNTFRDCTFNLNSGYGVNIDLGVAGVGGEPTPAVAGMQQHMFIGGNMEQNALGAVHVKSAFWTIFEDIDFESDVNLGSSGQIILGESATYLILKNCSIRSGGDTARAFGFNSSGHCRVENCRVAGRFPNIDVGVFDENCYRCTAQNNAWFDPNSASVNPFNGGTDGASPRWISNRGQNRGHSA